MSIPRVRSKKRMMAHRFMRVAAAAHRVIARRTPIRYTVSSLSSKVLFPKNRLFIAGALMTAVALSGGDESECAASQRAARRRRLHGKRDARIKAFRTLFRQVDTQGDRSICINELMEFLTAHDPDLSKDEASKMAEIILTRADCGCEAEGMSGEIHGDQLLSFKEFCAFMMTLLQSVFERCDVDNSGTIDGSEMKLLLQYLYGDDYMEDLQTNKTWLAFHISTKTVFNELTSAKNDSDIKVSINETACADFLLQLMVQGDRVDTHALVNLLQAVAMADDEWQSIRKMVSTDILVVSQGIDLPEE